MNHQRVRECLKAASFVTLFIEELGWDRCGSAAPIMIGDHRLVPIAQKRGMVAYLCAAPTGGRLPGHTERRKIERSVAKLAHEHLIVFTDSSGATQVWQWVRREAGRPAACREHHFHVAQPGDALIQKLEAIAFTLEEEEQLTLVDVTRRARAGFDVERVTKRFYDRFKREHEVFLEFITGISERADQEWYASVMLNRLMFVYFIQRKGFLDADPEYLRTRLERCRRERGTDTFYSFYRYFLLRLFHEGFGAKERTPELEDLLGHIPYLNGGLFDRHEIEIRYPDIQIPDAAFERVFDYFDQYQWHLDERPLRADNEINPDVLGYIFEKYINQKQMGAYYTKEDITEYISRSTVIPYLLDAARQKCRVAFENREGPTVWDLLRADPDRYIYPAMRHGVTWDIRADSGRGGPLAHPYVLPPDIADGVDTGRPDLIERRKGWNRPAPSEYALPTEIWREVVARRTRYEEVSSRLAGGEVRNVNDLVTLNLDLRQFAQDVIENCEGPDLLRAFWSAIEDVTILDPTCGSGAFLFAALNILEPLYEACLDRMVAFVDDLERCGEKHRPEKFSDFRRILEKVERHHNRRYFILKSIILNNLFGIDIMEEAVEICKLRLFLKLAAQVEPDPTAVNFGIEPLPDIDFNIRAGNTLVGFATYDDVERAVGRKLDFDNAMEKIRIRADDLQQTSEAFRARQVEGDASVPGEDKAKLRARLQALDDELNRYLASEYAVRLEDDSAYAAWVRSHQPFHWFVEFHKIMESGGFDVIIGNPPYVEISALSGQYAIRGLSLVETGNLYAMCLERFASLLRARGRLGVIVPISSVSTPRMSPLMRLLAEQFQQLVLANFAVRPGKLFSGVDMNLTIAVGQQRSSNEDRAEIVSSAYIRWNEPARPVVFQTLEYFQTWRDEIWSTIPKTGSPLAHSAMKRACASRSLSYLRSEAPDANVVYYHSGGRYHRKCIRERLSNEYKELRLNKGSDSLAICLLSSSLFYWFWISRSDCYHVTRRDIDSVPFVQGSEHDSRLGALADRLLNDLWANACVRLRNRADGSQSEEVNFRVSLSKPIIDEIDRVLAEHYGFTDEELDFIINYDIKYRLGREAGDKERAEAT